MDYSEQQRFSNSFIFILFGFSAIAAFVAVCFAMYEVYQSGENILPFVMVMIVFLAAEVFAYFIIFRSELETFVNREGFVFRYFPLVRTQQTIRYTDIQSWSLRSNKNIAAVVRSGIGYRRSAFARRTTFMMGSRDYLEIHLAKGKRFMFSTTNPEVLRSALRKYMAEKEVA